MIVTTQDKGRLLISYDDKYVGELKTFNPITKLFSKLFGNSENITINEKAFTIRKGNFGSFLKKMGIDESYQHRIRDLNEVISELLEVEPDYLEDKPFMREKLSRETRLSLNTKFLKALSKSDFDQATQWARQGAEVNLAFYDRESYGLSYQKRTSLPYNSKILVTKYTPMLIAVIKSKTVLYPALKKLGADSETKGKSYYLNQTVTSFEKLKLNGKELVHNWEDRDYRTTKTALNEYSIQDDKLVVNTDRSSPQITSKSQYNPYQSDEDLETISSLFKNFRSHYNFIEKYKIWEERKTKLENNNSSLPLKIGKVSLNVIGFIGIILSLPIVFPLAVMMVDEGEGDCISSAVNLVYNRKNPLSQGSLAGIVHRRFGVSSSHAIHYAEMKMKKYQEQKDLYTSQFDQDIQIVKEHFAKYRAKFPAQEIDTQQKYNVFAYELDKKVEEWLAWAELASLEEKLRT